ncbi:MAG: Rieske (2Fe-2S) protein [Planctomycetota bacterium]
MDSSLLDEANEDAWTTAVDLDPAVASGSDDVSIEVVLGERILAIFRHARVWYAIDGMCSHQGGPLAQGTVAHGCVTCPWHGWQYELETGIQTINRQPLQSTFPIRQIGTRVEVLLTQ